MQKLLLMLSLQLIVLLGHSQNLHWSESTSTLDPSGMPFYLGSASDYHFVLMHYNLRNPWTQTGPTEPIDRFVVLQYDESYKEIGRVFLKLPDFSDPVIKWMAYCDQEFYVGWNDRSDPSKYHFYTALIDDEEIVGSEEHEFMSGSGRERFIEYVSSCKKYNSDLDRESLMAPSINIYKKKPLTTTIGSVFHKRLTSCKSFDSTQFELSWHTSSSEGLENDATRHIFALKKKGSQSEFLSAIAVVDIGLDDKIVQDAVYIIPEQYQLDTGVKPIWKDDFFYNREDLRDFEPFVIETYLGETFLLLWRQPVPNNLLKPGQSKNFTQQIVLTIDKHLEISDYPTLPPLAVWPHQFVLTCTPDGYYAFGKFNDEGLTLVFDVNQGSIPDDVQLEVKPAKGTNAVFMLHFNKGLLSLESVEKKHPKENFRYPPERIHLPVCAGLQKDDRIEVIMRHSKSDIQIGFIGG